MGQKIRVMLNEAYTTASPLSFTWLCRTNSSQGWQNMESIQNTIINSRFKRKRRGKKHNMNTRILNITPHLHHAGAAGYERWLIFMAAPLHVKQCVVRRAELTYKQLRAAVWSLLWACMVWARQPCLCLQKYKQNTQTDQLSVFLISFINHAYRFIC